MEAAKAMEKDAEKRQRREKLQILCKIRDLVFELDKARVLSW